MQAIRQVRIQVLYNDALVAAGLVSTLRRQGDFEVDDDGSRDGEPAAGHDGPDVVVADYDTGMNLAHRYAALRAPHRPVPPVLIVTQRQTEWEIRRALEAGARGYLLLECAIDELVDAVRVLSLGLRHVGAKPARLLADSVARVALTVREQEVLRLLVEGHGNKAIANALDIAIGTVKSHLKSIFGKLDATSRTEVATVAERRGLLNVCVGERMGPGFTCRGTRPASAPPGRWPLPSANGRSP
jgi:two-component system NarL family response regulator